MKALASTLKNLAKVKSEKEEEEKRQSANLINYFCRYCSIFMKHLNARDLTKIRLLTDAPKLIRKVHRERNCAGRNLTRAEKRLQNLKGRKRVRSLLQKFPSSRLPGRERGRQRRGGDGGTCHSSGPHGVSGGSAVAGLGVGCESLPAAPSLAPSVGPRPSRALCPAAPASGARRLRPSPRHPRPGRRGERCRAAAYASGVPERTPARRARLRVLTGPPVPPARPSSPSSPRRRLSRGSPGGRTGRWDWSGSSVGRAGGRLAPGGGRGRPPGWALTGPGAPGRTAAVSAAAGCGRSGLILQAKLSDLPKTSQLINGRAGTQQYWLPIL
ncbi:collagen, type I, alpha 1a-like [Pan troglodytes]|uniref:collagen, type I, alpha 1a-like n=1 Tax=Pan troglodytes TaxID=9598 RepID=UPI0030133F2B